MSDSEHYTAVRSAILDLNEAIEKANRDDVEVKLTVIDFDSDCISSQITARLSRRVGSV